MKRKNVILSLVASISVSILVVGLFAVKQFMQWRMILNNGVFSAAHKDIMEELLGHAFIWGIIVLVCSLLVILFSQLYTLLYQRFCIIQVYIFRNKSIKQSRQLVSTSCLLL